MYLYIFDPFLGHKKYKKVLDKIETRITDLEISGRIVKLTLLDSIQEVVRDGVKRGATTIIIVGNDKTFCQAASAIADLDASLGFIPIDNNNKISEILGIPQEESACEVISARLIENLDLGRVNNHFFLSSVDISSSKVVIGNNGWLASLSNKITRVKISNLDVFLDKISQPQDGLFEVILERDAGGVFSFFSFKKGKIIDSLLLLKKIKIDSPNNKKGIQVLIDNWRVIKTPVEIEMPSRKIKIIVGKKRKF